MRSAPAPVAALSGAFDENTRRVGGNSTDQCPPTGSTSCSRRNRSLSSARVPRFIRRSCRTQEPSSRRFCGHQLVSSIRATTRSRAFARAGPMTSCRPCQMSRSSSCRRLSCHPPSRQRRRRARRLASSSPQGLATAPARLPISAGRLRARQGCALSAPIAWVCWCRAAKLNASFAASMPPAGDLALVSQSGAIAAGLVEWAVGAGESDFPR